MAEESSENKTEEPTGKRIEDAKKKGDIPFTRELGSTLGMVATLACLYWLGQSMFGGLKNFFQGVLGNLGQWDYEAVPLWNILLPHFEHVASDLALVMLAGFVAPIVGHVIQKGFEPRPEAAMPQLSKMDPKNGLKRLISIETLANLFKSMLKAAGLMMIFYFAVTPYVREIAYSAGKPYENALVLYGAVIFRYVLYCIIFLSAIIIADYWFQRFRFFQKLRMSRQEVKDELKDTEGSPEVRRKVREIQRDRSVKQINKDVPKATVVVTNPSHFAVALRYEKGKVPVPRVVAKGADILCQRIKEVARQHNVPIVENPPLARSLYRDVKVGHDIPRKFYSVVAKIIATILRLEDEKRQQRLRLLTPEGMWGK